MNPLLSLVSTAPRAAALLEKQQQKQKQASSLSSSSSSSWSSSLTPKAFTLSAPPRGRRRLAAFCPPSASDGGGGGFPPSSPRGGGDNENKSKDKEEDEADLLLQREYPLLTPPPSPPPPLLPVLSREAERTVGRTAMLGFACAIAGECLAGGGGPLSQLRLTGGLLPRFALDALLAGACASGLLFALSPVSRSWNDTAVREALLSSRSPVSKPAPTASKASPEAKAAMCEVLAGRLALVGLLFLVVVERQTGGAGALEQLGLLPSSSVAGGAGGVGDARALLLWLAFAGLAWATRFRSGGAGKRRR